jgi:hypothetical protein
MDRADGAKTTNENVFAYDACLCLRSICAERVWFEHITDQEGGMGRQIVGIVVAWCAGLAVCSIARADLTAFWRNNPITPQAIANDPTLAGMQSWSVMVTHTDSYWHFAGARLTLPAGSTFYRRPFGGNFLPSASAIAADPALAFHTYLTTPHHIVGNHTPAILTGLPLKEPVSLGGPSDPLPGVVSAIWGHPEAVNHPTPVGTYEVLRATFPNGVLPDVHPGSFIMTRNPDQTVRRASIPEPSAAAVMLGWGMGLILRRRV